MSSPYFLNDRSTELSDLIFKHLLSCLANFIQYELKLFKKLSFPTTICNREDPSKFSHVLEVWFHTLEFLTTEMTTDPFLDQDCCLQLQLPLDLPLACLLPQLFNLLLALKFPIHFYLHLSPSQLLFIYSQWWSRGISWGMTSSCSCPVCQVHTSLLDWKSTIAWCHRALYFIFMLSIALCKHLLILWSGF